MLYKLFLLYYLYKSDTSFFLLTFYFMLLFTRCATSNASRHFKSPLAMGRDAFKPKHASSVSISKVIDTGVNNNLFMSLKTYTVSSSQCPFFYAILERLCFIVIIKERIDLSNEFIEADVTYIIKELQSFSVHQRRNCRNHCSNYCIAAVNCTGTCIRCRPGGWYLHCDRCRICHLCTWRKQCTDCRTNSCIRNNRRRHCCQRRNGWTCHCNNPRRYLSGSDGTVPFRKSDQIHPIYDHNRIHFRNCCYNCNRTAERFLRTYLSGWGKTDRDNREIPCCC